jgi:predicted transcriptional regulator
MTVGVISGQSVVTKKPRVVVYLDESLKELLELLADKRNRSVSNLLETLAKQEVEQAKQRGELKDGTK